MRSMMNGACRAANADAAIESTITKAKRFIGLTRRSSAAAGESERGFHFILHNSSLSLDSRRPAVGCSEGLCVWLKSTSATTTLGSQQSRQ